MPQAKVLVIEDNPENMALLVYLLQSAGHTVFQATDGAEGLETASREAPDLILCDVRMPVLDGYEVAKRLRSDVSLLEVPLVAVTASVSGADRDKALAAGFDHFVSKPIEPAQFLAQIPDFLRLRPANPAPAAESEPV